MSKNTYDKLMELMEDAEERGEDFSEVKHDLEKTFLRQF